MENAELKENKMGVMPVNKLLINMSLPMVISMLFQACYNIVDSVFVARIADDAAVAGSAGTSALVAVGMAFPFQMLMIAFANGTGVGMNAMLSKALGEKDRTTVNKAAMNGIFLSGVTYIIFLVIGLFFSESLIRSQGGEGLSLTYGTQYLSIVSIASFGILGQALFERQLQSTGRTFYSMISQITGALINIVLDPILIFGYLGFPEMGVAGAAVATVIGQVVAGILALIFNLKKNPEIHISFKGFRPDPHVIKRIYAVGLPSIVMQAIGSVMTFLMNRILTGLNPDSVAVFTVYFKLQSFFFMPIFGMNNGMIPIVAYNYGAGKRSRMIKSVKLTMLYAFLFLAFGLALFEFIPDKLLLLFDTGSASLLELGVPALRTIALSYLFAWFCIIGG
ncbi:MAG: MATE family efflux transporter, partial [Lachnospiraceae bacterium]|nr:MATE family efflux transporter [Lachnospiraceae bacterium]